MLQILKQKNEEKEIDENKNFLLSLLPAFRKFNDDQKCYARTEIMNICTKRQLEEVLSPTLIIIQDAWENTSDVSSILNLY